MTASLRRVPDDQPNRHNRLVFSSVGDRSNVRRWLCGPRQFDLWIAYYGDDPTRPLADIADRYYARKGSKFGNLKYAYETWPDELARYEAILVMDDDILISAEKINRLFDYRDEYDLWLLQPAFSPLGKVSWPLTRVHPGCILRHTSFVEMTCPLFRRDKLDAFMRVFDPVLTGTGTDWWFMNTLGNDLMGRVAVIDAITCINPFDRSKGGVREADRLEAEEARTRAWQMVSRRYGLSRSRQQEFSRISKSAPMRWLSAMMHWPIDAYAGARQLAWRVKHAL